MHAIQVYVDEALDTKGLDNLRKVLMRIPHVKDVVVCNSVPHDVVIEYDETNPNIPMKIVESLHEQGLHSDIISA